LKVLLMALSIDDSEITEKLIATFNQMMVEIGTEAGSQGQENQVAIEALKDQVSKAQSDFNTAQKEVQDLVNGKAARIAIPTITRRGPYPSPQLPRVPFQELTHLVTLPMLPTT